MRPVNRKSQTVKWKIVNSFVLSFTSSFRDNLVLHNDVQRWARFAVSITPSFSSFEVASSHNHRRYTAQIRYKFFKGRDSVRPHTSQWTIKLKSPNELNARRRCATQNCPRTYAVSKSHCRSDSTKSFDPKRVEWLIVSSTILGYTSSLQRGQYVRLRNYTWALVICGFLLFARQKLDSSHNTCTAVHCSVNEDFVLRCEHEVLTSWRI